MTKSIIIIGAGISGLSAGCYGQMNGYDTQIFELHNLAGGLCTAWKRQGYTFDYCIHWLVGSSPKSGFNRIWQELGALQGRQIVNHEEFARIEGPNGKAFIVYTNLDRLEAHMKALAPGDSAVIEEMVAAIRRLSRMGMAPDKPRELYNLGDALKALTMLPQLGELRKWAAMPVADFAKRFTDPFLREAFALLFGLPDFPMLGMLFTLAGLHIGDSGYPVGGSLPFAQAIERRYLDLGGQVYYRSRVAKILVENDRAVGVQLADGSEHRADLVISAADGHATLFDMLDGKYLTDEIRGYYERLPIFSPLVYVSLGVARDLSAEPHSISWPLDEPLMVGNVAHTRMPLKHYGYDPTMAPAGKSALVVMLPTDYDSWKQLGQDRAAYEAQKQRIAQDVIAILDRRFPGLREQVEVVDVATPLTTERYTGNWRGSFEGWLLTTETMQMTFGKGMSKTLPGLSNFYMIGQWVEPGGGLPPAASSGRNAIQLLCHYDKKPFVTSLP